MDIHNLKLDWVSSEALAGMEWDKRLPNTVPQWHSIQFRLLISWLNDTKFAKQKFIFVLYGLMGGATMHKVCRVH